MKKKISILLFSLVFMTGCSDGVEGFLKSLFKSGGSAVPVTIENVKVREKAYTIRVPATLIETDKAVITLPSEATIDGVFVSNGDPVQAGDPLFRTVQKLNNERLKKLREELKDVKTSLEKNSYLFQNRDRLLDEGRIEQARYDTLEDDMEEAEAKIDLLRTEIGQLEQSSVNQNTIVSPIGGTIKSNVAAVGMTMQANRPILTIEKTNPMTAEFGLESYEAKSVRKGLRVEVSIPDLGGENINGKIVSIDSKVDPATQTFKVRASVPNQKGYLKIGMPCEVEFQSGEKQRMYLIPAEALIKDRRRYYVYTVLNGIAHKVEVVPKEKVDDQIEIARGLKDNDIVVVKGNDKLTEGTVVDIWGR